MRSLGEENLPGMAGGEQAIQAVEQGTHIVTFPLLNDPGMQGHAHPYCTRPFGPLGGVEGALSLDRSLQSLGSRGESGLERVANHLVCIATVGFNSATEDRLMPGECSLH